MTFGKGANQCWRTFLRGSDGRVLGVAKLKAIITALPSSASYRDGFGHRGRDYYCCKCAEQRKPGWNFDAGACAACKNWQREQQTPQAPPASATAASAGAASNEAVYALEKIFSWMF